MRNIKTTEKFIEQAIKIHGDKYDYSESIYKYSNVKIKVKCKKHGVWEITPSNHLTGYGCPKCGYEKVADSHRQSQNEFIKKAKKKHGDKYDYSEVNYINSYLKKVKIKCIYHNSFFYQLPQDHTHGYGCPLCGRDKMTGRTPLTFKQFVLQAEKVHGKRKYYYDKNNFKNSYSKIKIKCKKHGFFVQRASSHLNGVGCPHCVNKNEGKVKDLLYQYFKYWTIFPHKKIWDSYKDYNHRRYCDFLLEKDNIKIMIEYDGAQHFRPVRFYSIGEDRAKEKFKQLQLKDKLDYQFCKENNIILHRIKYDEDKEESIKKLLNMINSRNFSNL